jgi:hypothetical protein
MCMQPTSGAAPLVVALMAGWAARGDALLAAPLLAPAGPSHRAGTSRGASRLALRAASRPPYLSAPHGEVPCGVSEEWTWGQLSKGAERAAAGFLACHVGTWKHYDGDALRRQAPTLPVTGPEQFVQTRGRLRQTVKFEDERGERIQVWSVFEESALGARGIGGLGPLGGGGHGENVEQREVDGLLQVKVCARRERVDSVVVVSPGECMFSGDRALRGEGVAMELWLAEPSGATDEALKVGLGVAYGEDGQLQHVTRMRQLALRDPDEITGSKMCSPRFAASQAVRSALNPDMPVNFGIADQAVGQLAVFADNNINSAQGDELLSGAAIPDILAAASWQSRRVRVHSCGEGSAGAGAVAWEVELNQGQEVGSAGWQPADHDLLDLRFEDGVYARLPLDLSSCDEICFELGCLRSAALATGSFGGPLAGVGGLAGGSAPETSVDVKGLGGLHRVLAMAERGRIQTFCYEVYG